MEPFPAKFIGGPLGDGKLRMLSYRMPYCDVEEFWPIDLLTPSADDLFVVKPAIRKIRYELILSCWAGFEIPVYVMKDFSRIDAFDRLFEFLEQGPTVELATLCNAVKQEKVVAN